MEELREQPVIMPAPALDKATENEVVGEAGSQECTLGKFKSVQALMDAYENLQSEFTKKCQLLSNYQKDKMQPAEDEQKEEEKSQDALEDGFSQEAFGVFLEGNGEAREFEEEIKSRFPCASSKSQHSPYEVAWANVVLNHLKQDDKLSDPIINRYVLSDENVKNKIIENYLADLIKQKPPITMSSRAGARVSSVKPDTPRTLADAKKLVDKMFS